MNLRFGEITQLDVKRVLGGNCTKNDTVGSLSAAGYGIAGADKTSIFIDLHCEAEFRVCGTRKFDFDITT